MPAHHFQFLRVTNTCTGTIFRVYLSFFLEIEEVDRSNRLALSHQIEEIILTHPNLRNRKLTFVKIQKEPRIFMKKGHCARSPNQKEWEDFEVPLLSHFFLTNEYCMDATNGSCFRNIENLVPDMNSLVMLEKYKLKVH